jgi:hypothetical protein
MLPIPEQEKIGTVKNFISGLVHNKVTINSLAAMAREIEAGNIKPLKQIPKNEKIVDSRGEFLRWDYADEDLEAYLNYLVGIVTVPDSTTQGQVQQGIDQIYKLILILRKDMEIDPSLMLVPSDYFFDLKHVEHTIEDLDYDMRKRDEKFTTIFTQILAYLKTYGPILKQAGQDQEDARKLRGGKKNG